MSDNQMALLSTFADQAVIAIENVRLFNETKEALERQTATAEILRVIAGSPTDVQPVFDAIAASATRLLDGFSTAVVRVADGQVHLAGITSTGESGDEALRQVFPVPVGKAPGNVGRAIREKAASWTEDAEADPSYSDEFRAAIRARGWRSGVAVPMVRNNDVIGAINVTRRATGPFTDHQIGLLKTFADQAVIAIENVRLFNETREALERQTATAEILKVIASSPSDVQPVFDAILGSAVNLCSAEIAAVFPYDGKLVHLGATYNWSEEALKYFSTVYPSPPSPALLSGRTVLGKSIVQIVDAAADTHYDQNSATTGEWRRMLGIPIMREGEALGALVVCWREPGETPQRQVDLLQTFADQAVIAIQNVRLFNETKEALERQTATAEILKVIASSPSNVQPVFDAILESATRLCDGHFGILGLYEGESYKYVAHRGSNEKFANWVIENGQYKPRPGGGIARMTVERRPIHMADVREAKAYRDGNPVTLALADIGGVRTYLSVPMLKEDRVIGGITIYRPEVRPFSDKQIDLVSTFASQAVIAIENVRLFHEIEDKGRQLEVASQHKSNFLASMSHELRTPLNAILGFNEMIIGQVYGEVPADMQEPLNDIQTSGKHLLRLINNVLDLAKIEAGRMELSLQDYSVHDTVSSVHSTLRPLAAEKGLEFLATVPNDVPLAYGDGGRIAQCLMNLAGNSLKFTKAGKVEISVEAKGDLLVYKVTDTGIGIPPDKIGSLFTEFKQTDATIASEYGGTGLGLSISRKFVEMHGGRIWVESELGKGSAFIIEVPIRVKTP
jgi:signal transduction histidine kinase